ncbi:uncharacterized protein KIAA1614 homolog isoform X4 [Manis pentadactyla]|uniref:uncharacterized protein KIAA1614 homolog isoform X4 n=1 Tax=Manis pentadactyla TaxID=143292 RepID=UPI00255C86F4|nr:uncharacterized protein KIAA1614 homolog isoform X4 [Manis pentadactyla]
MQAAEPGGGGPRGTNIGSRTASSMEVTSAMERSGPEPQLDDGHLPGPWSCPREDRTTSLMVPQPPRAWGTQLQGPSVLESKVRALKEKMTTGKLGMSPGLTSHERPSSKKLRCRRVKVGGTGTLSEGSSQPDAAVVLHAQNLTNGQLDSSGNEEEPARNGGRSPPRPPAPGLHHWNGRSLWPPEAVWTLPDHERGLPPGPDSLPESPIHRSTPGQPEGPGPCNRSTHMPNLREGRPYPLQDGLVTGRDLDSLSLTSEEDCVPRPALLVGLWRAGDLGAPGTGGNALSLSDRVERNRRQLQEVLSVGGRVPPKVGIPAWSPSWDGAAADRPAGDADWDSGISLQDSDQNRTFGPKSEPVLSPRHEEATHLLQHARMKARTRPLRASHDIMPTIAQGSRDGRRSPALDPRMSFAFRDNLQNGNTSDSSSGESSSGQWAKPGTSPSHVRFEDESARDAESRYLERLQQRQRQVLSSALQRVDRGPLRCKPDLAHYISGGCRCRDGGKGTLCRLVGSQDQRGLLAPPPAPGSEGKCCACSSRMEDPHLGQGQAPPGPRVLQECEAACGVEEVQAEPLSSRGPSTPVRLLPADQGLCTDRIQETHIGHPLRHEEVDSALDSTDTSDSCRTDSEEVGTPQPGKASRPRLQGSRPRGGPRKFQKAETELPGIPQALCYLSAVDHLEVGDEGQEGRGQMPEGTLFPRGDAFSRPPALESKRASLGSQWQPGPGLGSHRAQPVDFRAPCWKVFATTSCMKLGSSWPGRQAQGRESHLSLETVCTSSQQTQAEVCQAQQPTASLTPDDWVPTLSSSRKTTSPVSHGNAALAGPCRPGDQGELVDIPMPPSRNVVLRTCELDSLQAQPSSPLVRHPLLALSTNNCNNSGPPVLQEPWGGATSGGRVEKGPCSQEPELPLENHRDGGLRSFLGSAAVGTTNPMSITLSLASEEPESSQEPEGGLQRTELSSGGHVSSRASPGVSAGAGAPSAVPSSRNKKSSSLTSTLGLKKLFLALGQGTRPRLGKTRSYSVEHLQPPAPGLALHTSTPKAKRAPSLQSLHLGSPSSQHRKAASFQNLHSLLSGKVDRSSRYLVGEPGEHSAAGRPSRAPPRRALSVEDVSAPSLARPVGRVVEVFADGTSQLLLQRCPNGTFGFCVASGDGRRDSENNLPAARFVDYSQFLHLFRYSLFQQSCECLLGVVDTGHTAVNGTDKMPVPRNALPVREIASIYDKCMFLHITHYMS